METAHWNHPLEVEGTSHFPGLSALWLTALSLYERPLRILPPPPHLGREVLCTTRRGKTMQRRHVLTLYLLRVCTFSGNYDTFPPTLVSSVMISIPMVSLWTGHQILKRNPPVWGTVCPSEQFPVCRLHPCLILGGRWGVVTLQQHGSQLPLRPWLLPQGGSALNWVLFGHLLPQSSWPASWVLYLTPCFPDLPLSVRQGCPLWDSPRPGLFFTLPCRSSLLLGAPCLGFP